MGLFTSKGRAKGNDLPVAEETKVYYLISDEDERTGPAAVYEQEATNLAEAIGKVQEPISLSLTQVREATEEEIIESREFMQRTQELYDKYPEIYSLSLAAFIATLEYRARTEDRFFDEPWEVLTAVLWDDTSRVVEDAKDLISKPAVFAQSAYVRGVMDLVCRMRDIPESKRGMATSVLMNTDAHTQHIDGWLDPHYNIRERMAGRR